MHGLSARTVMSVCLACVALAPAALYAWVWIAPCPRASDVDAHGGDPAGTRECTPEPCKEVAKLIQQPRIPAGTIRKVAQKSSECQRFATGSTRGVASDSHAGPSSGARAPGFIRRNNSGTFGYIRVHSGTFGCVCHPSRPPRHPRKPANRGAHSVRAGYIRRMHPSFL